MDKIDFVITWVDGNDPEWQQEKRSAKGINNGDDREARYRDWGTLRYWFRSVERYAPWVNKVFFVTYGHYPEWLNLDYSKLELVNHRDFIPSNYLPTFSCRPIEFNLHRIKGLSECFVYFNDDMFITNKVSPNDFFINGLPCDSAILDTQSPTAKGRNGENLDINEMYFTLFVNTAIINRHFNKNQVIIRNFNKWFSPKYGMDLFRSVLLLPWSIFTGFKNLHLPYSYVKRTFYSVWDAEYDLLDRACSHKFRQSTDVSSRLLSYWQLVDGYFYPRSPKIGNHFIICNNDNENRRVFEAIRNRKYKLICVNDEYSGNDYDYVRKRLLYTFSTVFPEKSQFERC